MSRDVDLDATPIGSKRELVAYFEAGAKSSDGRGVGTEHESFGIGADLRPVPYEGESGIGELLSRLAQRAEWHPELDRGNILALVHARGGAITLEPGGQLELSGRVARTIHETAQELDDYLAALAPLSNELGLRWLAAGCQPVADVSDIPWMPKSRYGPMREYLGRRGQLAHAMMKATTTIQANFDYVSESDAADILGLGVRLSPIVSAIFANSPLLGGRDTGHDSYRCHIWIDVDPDRTGVPAFFVDGTFTFERYVDYLLDVPLLFRKTNGAYVASDGRTFGQQFEGNGPRPSIGDFELHLSTVFTDLRLKRFIEVRMADGGSVADILALPALWKGVLYDDRARDAARDLFGHMTAAEQLALRNDVAKRSLQAVWRGQPVLDLAQRVVDLARAGLDRQAHDGPTESTFLDPLVERLGKAETPAARMRARFAAAQGDLSSLAESIRLI